MKVIYTADNTGINIKFLIEQRLHHLHGIEEGCKKSDISHIDMTLADVGVHGDQFWFFGNQI